MQSVRDGLHSATAPERPNGAETTAIARPRGSSAHSALLTAEQLELETLRLERDRENVLAELRRKRDERTERERAAAQLILKGDEERAEAQRRELERQLTRREERKKRQAKLESALHDAGLLVRYDERCRQLERAVFLDARKVGGAQLTMEAVLVVWNYAEAYRPSRDYAAVESAVRRVLAEFR